MRALAYIHDMLLTLVVAFLGALQLALAFWPSGSEIVRAMLQ